MNKAKKTTLMDRIRKAARAFRGKPAQSITVGVEIKHCSNCDHARELKRLMSLPNCNDCEYSAGNLCGYSPKIGEDVRVNCFMWKPKREAPKE